MSKRRSSQMRRDSMGMKMHHGTSTVSHENTFQLEPTRRFQSFKARRAAEEVVSKWFHEDTEYDVDKARRATAIISNDLLRILKDMNYDRYRFVVQTHVGQKRGQGLEVASRALTDGANDTYAEFVYENRSLWCVVLVHCLYYE